MAKTVEYTLLSKPVIYRFKLDLVLCGKSRREIEKSLRIPKGSGVLAWEFITIRDAMGRVNPAWKITENGEEITVEPKRKRRTA